MKNGETRARLSHTVTQGEHFTPSVILPSIKTSNRVIVYVKPLDRVTADLQNVYFKVVAGINLSLWGFISSIYTVPQYFMLECPRPGYLLSLAESLLKSLLNSPYFPPCSVLLICSPGDVCLRMRSLKIQILVLPRLICAGGKVLCGAKTGKEAMRLIHKTSNLQLDGDI